MRNLWNRTLEVGKMVKNSLLVIFTGGILVDPLSGEGLIDRKTYTALEEFHARLGGKVYLGSTRPPRFSKPNDGVDQISSSNDGVVIVSQQIDAELVEKIKPSIVLFPVIDSSSNIFSNYSGKFVFTDDYSPNVRRQVRLVGVDNVINKARIIVGHQRLVISNRQKVRRAAGIQCNGYAAYGYYRNVHPKAHLFFDHRVTDIQLAKSLEEIKNPSDCLRLGFSGRLQELKGVHLFASLLDELDRKKVYYTFDIIGEGVEREKLELDLRGRARFHGFMDFEKEWLPYVRSNIDLMVLPHIQGDSSSTYFESLGAGVPIVGFSNDSLTPLSADSQAALTVPMQNIRMLATVIENVANSGNHLNELRDKSFNYMQGKTFEAVMDGRVDHLLAL